MIISDFHCDEFDGKRTPADWAEYQDWLDSQNQEDDDLYFPEDFEDEIDPREFLLEEECEDPIDLYGGDDSHYWQYDE